MLKNSFEIRSIEEATEIVEELKKIGYVLDIGHYTLEYLFNKNNSRFIVMFWNDYGNFVSFSYRPYPHILDKYTIKDKREFLEYCLKKYQINNPTKQYIKNKNKVKLTLQNISDGLGVGVPPDLMEIVY